MAFRFKNASCVVLGTFNMYIVQPKWLADMKIIPKGIAVTIASKLDEPGFMLLSPKLGSKWVVAPNRILIETERATEDCGASMAKVLKSLPWTPLAGIGNNANFRAPLSELPSLAKNLRNAPDVPVGYEMAQRSFHVAFSQDNRVINVQLAITKEALELTTNVHHELGGAERKEASKIAQAAASNFLQDRKEVEDLIEHVFKLRIDNDNSNGKSA